MSPVESLTVKRLGTPYKFLGRSRLTKLQLPQLPRILAGMLIFVVKPNGSNLADYHSYYPFPAILSTLKKTSTKDLDRSTHVWGDLNSLT